MSITITVSPVVPHDALERIEALARQLTETDPNFQSVPISITRSDLADGVSVDDHEDALRGQLLGLLVEEAMKPDSDSVIGELR